MHGNASRRQMKRKEILLMMKTALAGVQINNNDCEWNAAVQIVEQVTQATPNSTIPKAEQKPK